MRRFTLLFIILSRGEQFFRKFGGRFAPRRTSQKPDQFVDPLILIRLIHELFLVVEGKVDVNVAGKNGVLLAQRSRNDGEGIGNAIPADFIRHFCN